METEKRGLILEGGAMRGLFTAGIMDVLLARQVAFDGLIGVSAGAAFGCNYKSGQPGRVLRYNTAYCGDKRYCSLRSWLKTGDLYGADFCYHEIPERLDPFDADRFAQSSMDFYVVCTDIESGLPVYKRCMTVAAEGMDWIRASASMPLVSRPVALEGKLLLDGGISDSIPLRYFESLGYRRNVLILTQPEGYVKKKNRLLPLLRLTLRKYPKLLDALARRHEAYNETLAYVRAREQAGEVFVFRPDAPLGIGPVEHDPARLRAVYDCGRQVGERRLAELLDFLS